MILEKENYFLFQEKNKKIEQLMPKNIFLSFFGWLEQ